MKDYSLESAFHSVIVPFGSEVLINLDNLFVILISSWLQGNSLIIDKSDNVIICS